MAPTGKEVVFHGPAIRTGIGLRTPRHIGAALMCAAGLVAALLAVNAEGRSLEDIAAPLSAADHDG
jgi:hypothetical protein